jgi:osmotically inducible lipoprotein OsmB
MPNYLKPLLIGFVFLGLNACTHNQIGTASGGAVGAGVGYAVSKNAWGSAIGGGAGALIGHELSKNN